MPKLSFIPRTRKIINMERRVSATRDGAPRQKTRRKRRRSWFFWLGGEKV